jgi:hypothetical protein
MSQDNLGAMNDHTQCPACHSPSTHVTKGEFKATGFQAFGNRVCNECGTAWRPACPRGVATVSIVAGFVVFGCTLTVAGSSLAKSGFPPLGDAKDLKAIGSVGFLGVMGCVGFVLRHCRPARSSGQAPDSGPSSRGSAVGDFRPRHHHAGLLRVSAAGFTRGGLLSSMRSSNVLVMETVNSAAFALNASQRPGRTERERRGSCS